MPIDPDEESLPSKGLPVAKPPEVTGVPQATAGKQPAEAGLPWGVCGVLHEVGELSAHPGSRGVTRYVADGIRYTAPPLKDTFWKPTPGQSDSYQMPWPDPPAQARTLASFRREIEDAARNGKLRKGNDPLLDELNHVAQKLCELAETLHRSKWTLGLIQPGNVLLRTTPDGPVPVLVDLGFTWKGSFGPPPWDASPGRPSWLDTNNTDWLYDVAAVRKQFADPNDKSFPPLEATADVRTLARLFAWLLTGSKDAEIRVPARSTAPETWNLLAAAAAGQVAAVRDLRDGLRDNPLSEHFTDPVILTPSDGTNRKQETKSGSMLWPILGVGFVFAALGLGVVGAYFGGLFDGKPIEVASTETKTKTTSDDSIKTVPTSTLPTNTKPTDKGPAPLVPVEFANIVDKLSEALKRKDLKDAATKLIDLEKLGKLPVKEAGERDKKRDEFLNLWYEDYKKVVALAKQPIERINALDKLKELEAQLKSVTDTYPTPATNADLLEKEKQCLDLAATLSRQLGSSP